LGSPFLTSSNSWVCSWNTEKRDLAESQVSILRASGQSKRFFPVCWVYLAKASLKRASKTEDEEDLLVVRVEAMV
jgi:hypothetical protein